MVDQVFEQVVDGREHRVVADTAMRHRIVWSVDGEVVIDRQTFDDTVRFKDEAYGHLVVRYSALGKPRRATWHPVDADAGSLTGLGGTDLAPSPGSPAESYERRVLEHPRRYAAIQTLGGVAKVVVPLVVAALLAQVAFRIPWPDLPSVPFPDLPSIPWPSIPWPDWDLPDWTLPGWLRWIVQNAKYVVPIIVAFVLAQAEIKRRRDQHAKRRDADEES